MQPNDDGTHTRPVVTTDYPWVHAAIAVSKIAGEDRWTYVDLQHQGIEPGQVVQTRPVDPGPNDSPDAQPLLDVCVNGSWVRLDVETGPQILSNPTPPVIPGIPATSFVHTPASSGS